MEQSSVKAIEKLAQQITYRPQGRIRRFRALPIAERSAVFNMLSPQMRQEILRQLAVNEAVDLLDHLDLRRAHHILDRMQDRARRARIAKRLKNDLHAKVEHFLQFHPQASTALVHLNYVFLPEDTTIEETASVIEDYLRNTGKVPEVLVSRAGALVGEVPLGALVRERNDARIGEYARSIQSIAYNAERERILACCVAKPHRKIVLLDTDGSVLGVVYSDDVLDLLGDSPAATLYSFAGVEASERPFDSALSKMKHRYQWLIINLVTVLIAGGVVALFEDTLTQVVLLAACIPVVGGMGGNASTQVLAVMVRGIAVGEITLKNSKPAIMREVGAALLNGAVTGALVALIAIALGGSILLGLVVGLSIVVSLVVAGFFGSVVPLIMKALGRDPAASAGIIITTATDVIGFFTLLGLATLILL